MGGNTIGGGTILDVAPPHRRRSDPALLRDLETLAGGDVRAGLQVRIARAGLAGISRESLRRETGLDPAELDGSLAALEKQGHARAAGEVWLAATAVEALEAQLLEALDAFHREEPLQAGMPTGALRGRLPGNVPAGVAELALDSLGASGSLTVDGDRVRRPQHRARLDAVQQALVERILPEAKSAGLEPPGLREWAERLGVEPEALRDLLSHLEREGSLVRAPGDLWFDREGVDALRGRVLAHLREHGRLETPAYKALIGTTRRTAVPLMELFDAERVTARRGDARVKGSSA
jgi:selenocysteine-specific elongation factor